MQAKDDDDNAGNPGQEREVLAQESSNAGRPSSQPNEDDAEPEDKSERSTENQRRPPKVRSSMQVVHGDAGKETKIRGDEGQYAG
jgi:hypothetical protein